MFLSSYESSVDAKKRVSVPAFFRRALTGQESVFLWPSLYQPCIEGGGQQLMESLADSMSVLDLMGEDRRSLATYIMGEARQAKLDEGGRIVLDAELISLAGVTDKVRFVGLGDRFQIWEPATFEPFRLQARERARSSFTQLKPQPRRVETLPRERAYGPGDAHDATNGGDSQ